MIGSRRRCIGAPSVPAAQRTVQAMRSPACLRLQPLLAVRRISGGMIYRVCGLLALVAGCVACVPAVSHGPRVSGGLSGGVTATLPLGPRYNDGDWGDQPFLYGPAGVDLGYGWAAAQPDRAAYRLGVHLPAPLVTFAQADAYVQVPGRWFGALDAGAGLNVSIYHVMPYLQLGRIGVAGSGWYTTQGVNFLRNTNDEYQNALYGVLWVPTLAYQWRRNKVTTHFFATAGLGRKYGPCVTRCPPAEERGLLSAGVALELHRRPAEQASRP